MSASLIKDPFDQDHEYEIRDLMKDDYRYTRTFDVEPNLLHLHGFLVCDGIDTLGVVSRERHSGRRDRQHAPALAFPLAGILVAGRNTLEVLLKSRLKLHPGKGRQHARIGLFQVGDAVKGYVHLRKGSSMFGWDWGPQLPDAGIWRDIRIEWFHAARIADVAITQKHEADGSVRLNIGIFCRALRRKCHERDGRNRRQGSERRHRRRDPDLLQGRLRRSRDPAPQRPEMVSRGIRARSRCMKSSSSSAIAISWKIPAP
ncbi:MAG: hypothetical protein MZW92_02755 [Comamonadaceae bacterium]|nr:hypothetical protein [Comamonadaceae bacterium]